MNRTLCTRSSVNNVDLIRAVIVVLSARKNYPQRQLVRQTYGAIKTANNVLILGLVFMLGNSKENDSVTDEAVKLQSEIDEFGDIVIGDFVDSYRNLTLKTIMAYEWVTSHCRDAQIVVKTDDDVLVNIFALTKELNSWSAADLVSSKIFCAVHFNESVVKDPSSPFYASPVDFPGGTFPQHCAGLGYVTSIRVIEQMVNEISKSFPGRVCTHEDVFMTGIVIRQINSAKWLFGRTSSPIERVNRRHEWVSMALESGRDDDDHLVRNLTRQTTKRIETDSLEEFRKRYNRKVFYLLSHSPDFVETYLRLWNIIKRLADV